MIDPAAIINGVLLGHGGHLFLAGGAHNVLDYALGRRTVSAASQSLFERNILLRTAYAESIRTPYLHVLSPDKQSVLIDDFPVPDVISSGQVVVDRLPSIAANILFPLTLLRGMQGEGFLHTDTHMSDAGNALVSAEIVSRFTGTPQTSALEAISSKITRVVTHCGDLGSKLSPSVSHAEHCLAGGWGAEMISNRLKSNDGIVDIWVSPTALYDARLMVFGDSFGRDLSRFLSFWFTQVVFLRTPFLHPDLVTQYSPDFLITQNIERYLGSVRDDEQRPLFHMYPYLKRPGLTYTPDPTFAAAFSALLSVGRKPYLDFRDHYLKDRDAYD